MPQFLGEEEKETYNRSRTGLSGNVATVVLSASVALEMFWMAATIDAPSARTWVARRAKGRRIVEVRMVVDETLLGLRMKSGDS